MWLPRRSESSNKYSSIAGVLTEDVDLGPSMVTKTFINGTVEKGSKINVEGNWFIRNKLLVLFEKQGVAPTVKGTPVKFQI